MNHICAHICSRTWIDISLNTQSNVRKNGFKPWKGNWTTYVWSNIQQQLQHTNVNWHHNKTPALVSGQGLLDRNSKGDILHCTKETFSSRSYNINWPHNVTPALNITVYMYIDRELDYLDKSHWAVAGSLVGGSCLTDWSCYSGDSRRRKGDVWWT